MSNQDDALQARIKRMKVQPSRNVRAPARNRAAEKEFDEGRFSAAILLPQLALVLGFLAMIAGRSIAMNQFMIEPNPNLLGGSEGAIVFALLLVIGLLFGKSNHISHGALVIGASLAFLGESFYVPLFSGVMESVYNENYVSLVMLGGY
jgi:hypothetical protein